jgi:hypothetical protein
VQKTIVRRATVLGIECERMEARAAAGDPRSINASLYIKMSNRYARMLDRLGITIDQELTGA